MNQCGNKKHAMENSTNFVSKNWLCGKGANDPGKGCLSQYHKLQGKMYWLSMQEAAKQRCKDIVDILKNYGGKEKFTSALTYILPE
ncbi:hypothetical protein RLOC_00014591 [Lonchura striata]|uniref:Uncharacterized protein n=1 Tax=Lonchura striata TaxID=40157 RepID=A0A218UZI4_9PASE|nr:hypothetical protein RLOC_00014591 [Lonchura striata domestica]